MHHKVAGKLCTVIDLLIASTSVVHQFAHDTNFLADLLNFTLDPLILDRGFYDFGFFVRLIAKQVDFITRIKSNAAFEVERILSSDYTLRDRLICFKTGDKTNHCYGCASSKSAKVKQCMVTSPQC